jgi:hypothetical protein
VGPCWRGAAVAFGLIGEGPPPTFDVGDDTRPQPRVCMMPTLDDVRRQLEAAVAEARRVGDSPLRADQLADRLAALVKALGEVDAAEHTRNRVLAALMDAERVLRRDDDGHEAARHLQTALRAAEQKLSKPSPFLD